MSKSNPSIIALIPARSGSKRVPGKNIHPLAGHPLIAYTICAARQSGIFSSVFVSTDSEEYAEISRQYGAEVPFLRPAEISGDLSLDIEWVDFTLHKLKEMGRAYDCFSILRPTSPFRLPTTIQRAWKEFLTEEGVDSLRAVEKCREHPGKMWVVRGRRMMPLLPLGPKEQPWHSTPYQALPEVYSQNASLEIAWSRVVFNGRTIAGEVVMPFFTEGYEGFDVNRPYDWELAERLAASGEAQLPKVEKI
ncbi:MAG: acylneuraminate cytidylyltransferase family protein [Chloroflexi bacterium]|nr:acylneuraminate cytidylyltransferase family protein [Chloroflexota bacterium]MDL1942690.1 acylneuraminate cytidylyltransferase family protein [Chloroflexi bacterium CFX2]